MPKMGRRVRNGCLLGLGICISSHISVAQADVLEQLPADAAIVVKVNHLAETNTKFASLMQQLGITDLVPTMKDPLQAFQDSAGLAGLNAQSDLAFYLTADDLVEEVQSGGDKGVIVFPVSDYKAFLGSQTVVRTENEVTVIRIKGSDHDWFVEQRGGYAAISHSAAETSGKHEGLKPTGTSAEELTNDDAGIFINVAPLKTLLLPKLNDGESQLVNQVQSSVSDPGKQKVAVAAARRAVQMAREFLNDTEGAVFGFTLADKGIKSSFALDFVPESYLGTLAATMKVTDGPLLAGLPKQSYMVLGGSVLDPAWSSRILDDLVNPIVAELPGMGEDGKKILDGIAVARDAAKSAEGGSFAAMTPNGEDKHAGIIQEVFIFKGDSAKLKAAQAKAMDMTGVLMDAYMQLLASQMGNGNAAGGSLFKMTTTPKFKTINNVVFDRWKMEINPDNTSAMAMQMGQSFAMMYGTDGVSVLGGTIDPKTYIGSFGLDDKTLFAAIESAKTGQDVLSDSFKEIDANLPKKRALVEYVRWGDYATTVINLAKAQGLPFNISIPPELPPMGITMGSENSSFRIDGYVPTRLIQGLFQAGVQAYMQAQNHAGGGNGGV